MTHVPLSFASRLSCILLAGIASASAATGARADGSGQEPKPAGAAAAAPKVLRFEPETIEYGEVEPGTPVTATLTITNVSNAPITVEGIKGGCGCTTVTAPPKQPVAPGASFTVSVTMDPGTKPGVSLVKPVHVTIAGGGVQSMQIKAKVKGTPVPPAETVTLFRLPAPTGDADRADIEREQDEVIRAIDARVAPGTRSAQFRMRLHRESGMLFVHGSDSDVGAVRAAVKALPSDAGVRESQGEPGA